MLDALSFQYKNYLALRGQLNTILDA